MGIQFEEIPLHKLNIPAETLRQSSSNAGDHSLKQSLHRHGVLSPFVVTELGSKVIKGKVETEYAVWDGTRRTRLLRELDISTSTTVPAIIVEGGDQDALVAQVNINNMRERLSEFAEAEALRQLVKDHGMKQVEAADVLGKSKGWASQVMKIWQLPGEILREVRSGEMPISHARVISQYQDEPSIMKMLVKESLSGNVSKERLKAMAVRAKRIGVTKARAGKPKNIAFGNKSKIRVEPMQKSMRLELQLDDTDDIAHALEKVKAALENVRGALGG
jgi:ParB family chromosome partitioning protein